MISRRTLLNSGLLGLGSALVGCKASPAALSTARKPRGKLPSELLEYDALGLAQLVREGEVSQQELIEAAISRINLLDGKINAMTTRSFERAFRQIELIQPDTVFAGVPTLVKDLVDVSGVKRTNASRLTLNNVPAESVDYIKAMEESGLNILGMTNTPEFASLALTNNDVFGPTRNPWDLSLSAGGSSGGSAAAVAAGYVPLAHGTDGGGSIRIPASCCGLLGMKASRYRQVSGEADGGHQFLRTHQSISRTVRDSATLLGLTENPKNHANYPPMGMVRRSDFKRLRIAFSMENGVGELPTKTVQESLNQTALLCESLGHSLEVIENPINGNEMMNALEAIMLHGTPYVLAQAEKVSGKSAEESGLLSMALVDLGRFAATFKPDAKRAAIAWFEDLTIQLQESFFPKYDAWLTPTMLSEAPEVDYLTPNTKFSLARKRNRSLMSYTALANGIGAPAMSIPLFKSNRTGLPIGCHFLAAPGADKLLYQLAYELEESQPWSQRWAPASAKYI